MAMVLLISAVLMIRTLAALRRVNAGFADANHVQTVRIATPQHSLPISRRPRAWRTIVPISWPPFPALSLPVLCGTCPSRQPASCHARVGQNAEPLAGGPAANADDSQAKVL
jgi:hypothetical protein